MPQPVIFYRMRRNQVLSGFGDAIGNVPLLGKSLGQWQKEIIEAVGGILCDTHERGQNAHASAAIYFGEQVYFCLEAAKKMALHAQSQVVRDLKTQTQVALAENTFNRRFSLPPARTEPPSGLDLWLAPPQVPATIGNPNESPARIPQWVMPQKTYSNWIDLPPQVIRGGRYHLDQSDVSLFSIDTPFHLLQANMGLNLNRQLPLRKRVPRFLEKNQAFLNSRLFYRALRWSNRIGKRCKIHPTAVIEGSVIGDGVSIGAYAVVRNSILGEGTTLEDQTSVIQSVLGKRNYVANKNHLCLCLTYNDVYTIHGPYQFSIFGEGSAAFAVINGDVRMDNATIRIATEVGLIDSLQPLLGIAYGHRSKVAGGNLIAPGRLIPNDAIVTPPKSLLATVESP